MDEFIDCKGCLSNLKTEVSGGIIKVYGFVAGGNFKSVFAEAGSEIHIRLDRGVAPGASLVGSHLDPLGFQGQKIDARESDQIRCCGKCPQSRHNLVRIGEDGHTQVKILDNQSHGIRITGVVAINIPVTVAVHKIGPGSCKQIHIGKTQRKIVHGHVFNA